MKVSKHFDIRELVPPETWKKWGTRSTWFIRQETIELVELLHSTIQDEFNVDDSKVRIVINNYHYTSSGHIYKYSGYRPQTAYENDSILKKNPRSESLHRQGIAVDVKCYTKNSAGKWVKLTTNQVHALIRKWKSKFMAAGLTVLEKPGKTPTWTHMDCRDTGLTDLMMV